MKIKLTLALVASSVLASSAFAKSPPIVKASFRASAPAEAKDFEGIVRLSNCSASLVKFKGQSLDAKALVLTNDHCVHDQPYKRFEFNLPYARSLDIYNAKKEIVPEKFYTTRIAYATQTDTDVALLELRNTYREILDRHGIRPLDLEDARAAVGDAVSVITGYFGERIDCAIDAFVYKLVESTWIWRDSYRYRDCETRHGTSGSPIVLRETRRIVGINNTGNDDGERCTLNNPCEVDERGTVTVRKNRHYGQQIDLLSTCLDAASNVDPKVKGCRMFGGDAWEDFPAADL